MKEHYTRTIQDTLIMNTVYNREHMSRNEGLNQAQAVRQSTIKSRFEELDKAIANNAELTIRISDRLKPILNPIGKSENIPDKVEPPRPPTAPIVEALEDLIQRVDRNSRSLEELLQLIEL